MKEINSANLILGLMEITSTMPRYEEVNNCMNVGELIHILETNFKMDDKIMVCADLSESRRCVPFIITEDSILKGTMEFNGNDLHIVNRTIYKNVDTPNVTNQKPKIVKKMEIEIDEDGNIIKEDM